MLENINKRNPPSCTVVVGLLTKSPGFDTLSSHIMALERLIVLIFGADRHLQCDADPMLLRLTETMVQPLLLRKELAQRVPKCSF